LNTWLIDGGHPLPHDAAIAAALASRADPLDGGGIALNLAILGPDGLVYRAARAWDLADYQRACAALLALGLLPTGRPLRLGDLSFEDVFFAPAVR
jgi:hypothetical protein